MALLQQRQRLLQPPVLGQPRLGGQRRIEQGQRFGRPVLQQQLRRQVDAGLGGAGVAAKEVGQQPLRRLRFPGQPHQRAEVAGGGTVQRIGGDGGAQGLLRRLDIAEPIAADAEIHQPSAKPGALWTAAVKASSAEVSRPSARRTRPSV